MTTEGGVLFGGRAAGRIIRAVRQVERMNPPGPSGMWANRPTWQIPLMAEGTLDADLAAATSITVTSTATLSVYRYNSGGTFADTTENITITNRDENFSASSGDYLIAGYIAGEWRPLTAGQGGGGGQPIGSTVRYTSGSNTPPDGTIHVICNGSGITVNVGSMSPSDGDMIMVRNIHTLKATVSVQGPFYTTDSTSAHVTLAAGGSHMAAIYEGGSENKWWIDALGS